MIFKEGHAMRMMAGTGTTRRTTALVPGDQDMTRRGIIRSEMHGEMIFLPVVEILGSGIG